MVMVSVRILYDCMLATIACMLTNIDFPSDIEIQLESTKDYKTDAVNIMVCV